MEILGQYSVFSRFEKCNTDFNENIKKLRPQKRNTIFEDFHTFWASSDGQKFDNFGEQCCFGKTHLEEKVL